MKIRTATLAAFLAAALAVDAQPAAGEPAPAFTRKPVAVKTGAGAVIAFAVDRATDVEVAVLDADGKVIRHLAAGVLGSNAPAPLRKDALAQELTWDGRGDFGEKLPAGNYTARVRLGLRPAFDRFLGDDPNTLGLIRGLATGPDGELYVLNLGEHAHRDFGSTECQVFDRQGAYRRTLMPYRADCLPARVGAFGVLDLGEGGKLPFLHANHLKSFYPFEGQPVQQCMAVSPDGRCILTMRVKGKGTVLTAIDAKDGGVPTGGAFGPSLGVPETTGAACLAYAPDGRTLYVSGVATQQQFKPLMPQHAVYRVKWGDKTIVPFIGRPGESGAGEERLNDPQGVDLDRDGNIYVADRGNNRVAVFAPDGKFLAALPVENPCMLGVHRKSGAVFVMGGGDPPDRIFRFDGRGARSPSGTNAIPRLLKALKGKKRYESYPVFALDGSGEEPVAWVGAATPYDGFRLLRYAGKDGQLGEPEEKGQGVGFRSCRDIQVDRKRERIYCQLDGDNGSPDFSQRYVRVDGTNGVVQESLAARKNISGFFAYGRDEHVYIVRQLQIIFRYDRDFKPSPFPGRDTNAADPIPGHQYGQHIMGRGMSVRPDGTIYVLHENLPEVHKRYGISIWTPDGRLKRENVVGQLSQGALSLRMDPPGNIYVGDPVKPWGEAVPAAFAGRVDATKKHPRDATHHYPILYGSILKFGPAGGAGVGPGLGGLKGLLAYDVEVGVRDALWMHSGVGPIPAYKGGAYQHYVLQACSCEGMRFDVDDYGRTFAPDAARFRVLVLDTAGNEIGTFGAYGNRDATGAGSAIAEPAIPFAWPMAVGVSDRAAYVSDLLNRRIVRVRLDCQAQETVALALP